MAAQVNLSAQSSEPLKGDDYLSLLAWRIFCFENFKAILQVVITNKKASDLLKETNALFQIMDEVNTFMSEFQLKLFQNFIYKEKLEEIEEMQKQFEQTRIRFEELEILYSIQYTQEIAKSIKAQELAHKLNDLTLNLTESNDKIIAFEFRITDLNTKIENKFQKIIQDVSEIHHPIGFIFEDQTFKISQQEIIQGLRNEFQTQLTEGTLNIEHMDAKVRNAFKDIAIGKLLEKEIEITQQAHVQIEKFVDTQSKKFMGFFHNHQDSASLSKDLSSRDALQVELNEERIKNQNIRIEIEETKEEIKASIVQYSVLSEYEDLDKLEELLPEEDEKEDVQLYPENKDEDHPDKDDYQPPPSDPPDNPPNDFPPPEYEDRNPVPGTPPPEYNEMPIPNNPPQAPGQNPVPNIPPPQYAEIASEKSQVSTNVSQKQDEQKLQNQTQHQPEAKLKSSSGGIFGKLNISADVLKKSLEESKTAIAKKKPEVANAKSQTKPQPSIAQQTQQASEEAKETPKRRM